MRPSKLLAHNMKAFRQKLGFTQAELAEGAGVSIKLISEIERGIVWPREETLINIGTALSIDPTELLFNEKIMLIRFRKLVKNRSKT